MNKVLSDERLGAKLRVTENRCVLFNSLTFVYLALLTQHRAFYAKVDSTPTFIYIYVTFVAFVLIFIPKSFIFSLLIIKLCTGH